MPRLKLYFLFCFSFFSLLVYFWYLSSSVQFEIDRSRHEVVLRYDQSSTQSTFSSLDDADWPFGDPCEDSRAERLVLDELEGRLYCHRSSAGNYTSRFRIFNTDLTINPRIVFTPLSTRDITLALQIARRMNLTVTVKNGGHNPAGFSLNDGGMVIDMAYYRKVEFVSQSGDPSWAGYNSTYVVAQGGALWSDVQSLLKTYREDKPLSIVGGGCPSVGVVGLTLGGGIGWISRHRGLVSDNMLALKIILPNGTLAIIDDEKNPNLMWALRGAGGSNFGVVIEVLLRTFPVEESLLAGRFELLRHPLDAQDLFDLYADHILNRQIDERLTVDLFTSVNLQDAKPAMVSIGVAMMFDGPIEEGKQVLQPFLDSLAGQITVADSCRIHADLCKGTQQNHLLARQTTIAWLKNAGPFLQNHSFLSWSKVFGTKHTDVYWTSGVFDKWTRKMTEDSLKALQTTGVSQLPQDVVGELLLTFEHLGGRIGQGPSIWKHKTAGGLVSIQVMLLTSQKKKKQMLREYSNIQRQTKSWFDHLHHRLKPSFTGAYVNYAYEGFKDWQEEYYGIETYNQLVKIKRKMEDNWLFRSRQRIGDRILPGKKYRESALSEGIDAHHLDRDSFAAESSFLCPDWLLEHSIMTVPTDILPLHPIEQWNGVSPAGKEDYREGKTVLITGGSDGIGFSAMLNFLSLGINVIITSQTNMKCEETETKVYSLLHDQFTISPQIGKLYCFQMNLEDLESIEKLKTEVKKIVEIVGKLDVVVMNAGHNGKPGIARKAGNLSKSLVVNYLGHFYLCLLLIQDDLVQPTGRVVIQSSEAAMAVSEEEVISLLEVNETREGQVAEKHSDTGSVFDSKEFRTYAVGKALSVMFALELHRRLQHSSTLRTLNVFVTIPPGTAQTPLSDPYLQNQVYKEEILEQSVQLSTAEAALPCVYASLEKLDQMNLVFVESNFTRELVWEYKKQPMGAQFVVGCQVGSVGAHYRFADWLKTNTTCRIWNWTFETLNNLRDNALHLENGLLSELEVAHCHH